MAKCIHSLFTFADMGYTKEPVRCPWCLKDGLYKAYHDLEWGRPSRNDAHLFQMMILESFQAGLSWYTILAKRENFRTAFDGFDVHKVAEYTNADIEQLMQNSGIVRNRLKLEAAVNNAKCFLEVQAEFGCFSDYLWRFTNNLIIDRKPASMRDVPATSAESDAMAKDLKARGFKFMGSTVCYAKMQSIGMVNDHLMDCFCRK